MAGFIEKFLDAIKLSDRYEDDEDFDEYYDDDLSYQTKEEERARSKRSRREKDNSDLDDIDLKGNLDPEPKVVKKNNVVPLTRNNRNGMEVCVIKPASMEDSKEIVDTLLRGRAVVINLEGIHIEIAQRIIDFTFGACYSIEGNLNKVTEYIFIVTPSNIELSGDLLEVLAEEKFDSASFKL